MDGDAVIELVSEEVMVCDSVGEGVCVSDGDKVGESV